MSEENYKKAKAYLTPLSSSGKPERRYSKEKGFNINQWLIELHGTMHTGLSSRVDKSIDEVQNAVFYDGRIRSWMDGRTQVFLPGVDEDVFLVFTHFIKHFYKEGGVTMRQMCDWCRLLWTYRVVLDVALLETWLKKAGLTKEWKVCATFSVDYLGMSPEMMPLYSDDEKWKKKASSIVMFILKGGEWRKWSDTFMVARIFPWSTLKFTPGILFNGNWMKIKERISFRRIIKGITLSSLL